MSRITLIGKNGFMAQSIEDEGIGADWLHLSHSEALASDDWLEHTDCIINFAYAPDLRKNPYNAELDLDTKLAKRIANTDIHYIMLSSRMVYGHPNDAEELFEYMPAEPENIYGSNKLTIENNLLDILGEDRVTILRLANIFGFEPERKSFFGMALTKLANEGQITYDMNPFVKRDFLSIWRFGDALDVIAQSKKGGVFNLGSGIGIETGLIAEWLIEGFGSGALLIENMQKRDAFWLNMEKTYSSFDIPRPELNDIREDCLRCGVQMKSRIE